MAEQTIETVADRASEDGIVDVTDEYTDVIETISELSEAGSYPLPVDYVSILRNDDVGEFEVYVAVTINSDAVDGESFTMVMSVGEVDGGMDESSFVDMFSLRYRAMKERVWEELTGVTG